MIVCFQISHISSNGADDGPPTGLKYLDKGVMSYAKSGTKIASNLSPSLTPTYNITFCM
jgi:hypothetical protein